VKNFNLFDILGCVLLVKDWLSR